MSHGSRREFAGEASVSIHSLAVYIYEEINGTFPDIFKQLYERVDLMEYPNNGSITMVSVEDAHVIVEDIGADAGNLSDFLAEHEQLEKSVGFPAADEAVTSWRLRHPRHARHGLKGALPDDLATTETSEEDLPTKELLANSKREAVGIYFKKRADGYMVYSRKGATFKLTDKYMKQRPTDSEFNVWYNTTKSEGWQACTGACAGHKAVMWYNVETEDAPFIPLNQKQFGCIGYCRMARKHQEK